MGYEGKAFFQKLQTLIEPKLCLNKQLIDTGSYKFSYFYKLNGCLIDRHLSNLCFFFIQIESMTTPKTYNVVSLVEIKKKKLCSHRSHDRCNYYI